VFNSYRGGLAQRAGEDAERARDAKEHVSEAIALL